MWRKICKERAILNFFFIVLFFQGYKMHTFSLHCLHFPRLLLQKTNYLPISVNQWQKNPLWICISEMNFVLKESPNLCLLYCHFHISKMEKVLPEKDIINFRFLTTETNLKQFLYTTFSPHVLQKEELLTKIYLYINNWQLPKLNMNLVTNT